MKTLHLAIITGSGIVITIIFGLVFFFPSAISGIAKSSESINLDLSNSTTENPLGIKAEVVMEPDRSISCPTKCVILPTPHLILISEKGAQFVGYQVCDGASCKKDVLDNSLYAHLAQVPQNYSGAVGLEASHINLGNLPWSVGDTVHILVKAFPVTLQPNNIVIREPEKTMVIDFGESKIIGNYNTTNVSTIVIPKGSSDLGSGKNYEPRYLLVVLGVNNTVKWINEDDVANTIVGDTNNQPDPLFEKGPYSKGVIMPGKSFNFTFTKIGEYQYDTEPHPWLYGWVLVLPQSPENATQTVIVNDTKIPGPCEIFALPCPNSTSFTAQKFGPDVYIEKVTINGYDKYAIVHPSTNCVYPPSYNGNKTCRNPDDLAILRLVGVDTSIPQENLGITINGLNSTYAIGSPVNFGIKVKGYGHCDYPSVLVIHEGVIVWQGKTAWVSCPSTMSQIDDQYTMKDLGGPFYLNQSGTYTVHVGYASNMTEKMFNVVPTLPTGIVDSGITHLSVHVYNSNYTINYDITGNNKILDANMDVPSKSLVLSLETSSNGTLTVTLPRELIDAKLPTGNDDKYYVLVNGQESTFQEINATTIDRTISIPFTNETHVIEIIGAQII